MLKIVVFDSGYGGELFADKLEQELPVAEVIRVIDWRHADEILRGTRSARRAALEAIGPYIGRVDLVIFANYLLTLSSLQYFRRKYKNQKFIGLELKRPDTFIDRNTLVIATKAISFLPEYYRFVFSLKRHILTLNVDSWISRIDDGELPDDEIRATISKFLLRKKFQPDSVILACSQLSDIKTEIKYSIGRKVCVYDGFRDTLHEVYRILKIRGNLKKK